MTKKGEGKRPKVKSEPFSFRRLMQVLAPKRKK